MTDFRNTLLLWDIASGQENRRHTGAWTRGLEHVEYLPAISSVMAVATENGENTLHKDWTSTAIVPLSSFQELPDADRP